jgi:hypothetical protein
MSRPIELHASLDVPAELARDELARIMKAIHDRTPPYDGAALRVGLHDLRLPVAGDVGVPIEADVTERPMQYVCTLKIAASGGAEFFPKFSGSISVSPLGSGASELWLQGEYDVPLGGIGAAIDATLLSGAARRSLAGFLDLLARDIVENVRKAQEGEINRRLGHPGA